MKSTGIDASSTLYHQVAVHIETMISQGLLKPGDRIPSVRQMSRSRKVSVATVLEAYFLLENKGIVEARPQSGFYVKPPTGSVFPEPTLSKPSKSVSQFTNSDFVVSLLQNGRDPKVIQLGAAAPSSELMPVKMFNRITASILREQAQDINDYDMPPGHLKLRRLIAKRAFNYGCDLGPDDILTTVGGMEAINLALLATTKPGDIIAVDSPTYYGVHQAIESYGLRALEVPTSPQTGICLDQLEEMLKSKKVKAVLAMPNFNNPLGSLMTDENKERLVAMLAKRDIPFIEDDVYGDLHFDDERPKPVKAFDKTGNVLLCCSFSKTISPGSRVGWLAAGKYMERVIQLKFMNTIATGTLPQRAIAEFLENGGYDRHLRRTRAAYQLQVQQHRGAIERYFPSGTKITRPLGGFLLWVEMPKHVDSFKVYEKAMDAKISVAPGPIFSSQLAYRNCLRINCGAPYSDRIDKAMEKLGRIVHKLSDEGRNE